MSEDDRRTVEDRPASAQRRSAPAAAPDEPVARDSSVRYLPGAEIARGGMGRVVEAEDALLGRTVALKETLEVDDDARRRFEREVRITARLEHPSIVPVYDAGRTPAGLPFYVMRRLTGRPLDHVIRAAATLDERLTHVPNVLAVLDAVGHAHRRGIIHRDLKPANVLIGELGETVVIDWGLAKVIGEAEIAIGAPLTALGDALTDATIAGTVVGTPGFMSPEQAVGQDVDARSDVYALGATLYHLLAGRPPYIGTSASEILDRTVAEPPPPLTALAPGVPRELVTIVGKAMAPAVEHRYPDAVAMGEDLRRFLSGRLVAAHHYSPRERLIRYVRRHRRILAVVALAVVVLAVVGALSLRRILADRDRISTARAAAEAGRAEAEAKSRELRTLADGLIVEQARSSLRTDPTFAVALLKRLPADSPQWPAARAVIAEARSHGLAYALPGHGGETWAFEIAPDANRLLSTGKDGKVRVHDLANRTSVTIDTFAVPADVQFRWVGSRVARLDYAGHELVLLDPTSGRVDQVVSTTAGGYSVSFTGVLIWFEQDGAIRRLLPGTPDPDLIATIPGIKWVGVSPTAGWILAETADNAQHVLRGGLAGWSEVMRVPSAETSIEFTLDDDRMAYAAGGTLMEWDLTGTTPKRIRAERWTGRGLMYAVDVLLAQVIENNRISWVDLSNTRGRRVAILDQMNGMPTTLGPGMIAIAGGLGTQAGRVTISYPRRTAMTLHALDAVTRVATRPGCHWLVGAAGNHLLVWDLREAMSAVIDIEAPANTVHSLGPHHMVAADHVQSFVIDTRTQRSVARDALFGPRGYLSIAEDGILLRYFSDRVDVTDVESWTTRSVTTRYEVAVARDVDTLVVADADGALAEIAVATGVRRELGTLGATPNDARKRKRWVLFYGGRRLWRHDGNAGESAEATAEVAAAEISADGTVYAIVDNTVVRWATGATAPELLIAESLDLTAVAVLDLDRVVVLSADRALWRVNTANRSLVQVLPAVGTVPQISRDGTCAVAIRDDAIVVADLVGHAWWTIASVDLHAASPGPVCDTVYALNRSQMVEVFDISLPRDVDSLRAWVEARTNARASDTHGVIEWVLPPS